MAPALDILLTGIGSTAAYKVARERAASVASSIPLVRVVVPQSRRSEELRDVFQSGRLSADHRSEFSAECENRLGVGSAVYFHAGRTHPDYGSAVFGLGDIAVAAEATPFGLGALFCRGNDKRHDNGSCLSPIAHASDPDQAKFVKASIWAGEWRASMASYLAIYFDGRLEDYFAPGVSGRPTVSDPDGIFLATQNRDWRSWTVEVRALGDIDLFAALERDEVLFWGLEDSLEAEIYDEVWAAGVELSEFYPLFARLPANRRVVSDTREKFFCEADNRSKTFALQGL